MASVLPVWPLTALYIIAKRIDPFKPSENITVIDQTWKDQLTQIIHILKKHGIEYVRTIDHQLMAVAGSPMLDSSDTENLVWATLEIREWLNRTSVDTEAFPYQYKIGLHTDRVVAGIVDSAKMPYTLYSHAMHFAHRMARTCRFSVVNMSEYTHAYVDDVFECELWGILDSLGEIHKPSSHTFKKAREKKPHVKTGWVRMYEVLGKKAPGLTS